MADMIAVRSGETLEISAPAKINLFLEICSKRDDGFHNIETLMCGVALFDRVQFTPNNNAAALQVDCQWAAGMPQAVAGSPLPPMEQNLAFKALKTLQNAAQTQRGGVLTLVKRIPAAAGMGGASADAAAALVAANIGWELNWPYSLLAEIAAELGSDVPFFLGSSNTQNATPAICTGRGEKISTIKAFAPRHVVVARPAEGLSTPAVYRVCSPSPKPQSCKALVSALQQGDIAAAGRQLKNRLQPAARSVSPVVSIMENTMKTGGFWGWQMSGSGTAFFGIARHARHARRTAARLRATGVGYATHTHTI